MLLTSVSELGCSVTDSDSGMNLLLEKPVGTICRGPTMLCSAKCLKNRRLTCLIAVKDDVENAGYVIRM